MIQIKLEKVWNKYPDVEPNEDEEYDICWHWNKGVNESMLMTSQVQWDTEDKNWWWLEGWDENGEDFEKPSHHKDEGFERIVVAWSKITLPKF